MFKRRQRDAATAEGTTAGDIDRRRLMRLGGRAAVGAAVVGLANGASEGTAAAQGAASPTRSGVVSMTSSRRTVSVPGGLTRKSRVVATVNSDPDRLGFFPVIAAVPDPATGTIKIQTNSCGGQPPYPEVAWVVFD